MEWRGGDGGDGAERPGRPLDARTQLVRPESRRSDDDANGDVRLKEHRGRSAIHVFIRHLDQSAVYDVTISPTSTVAKVEMIPGEDL